MAAPTAAAIAATLLVDASADQLYDRPYGTP